MSPRPLLPYGRQSVDEEDIAAVVDVLRSDWLTTGPAVDAFEAAFAACVGAPHAAACANGTAALHLAALALDLGPSDSVVVPAITFLATANAARYVGAEVVFADVDPETGLLMPEQLAAALKAARADRVAAVFPVHLNGQVGDPAGLATLAERHGLHVVEDACHALGGSYEGNGAEHRVGACAHADLATFSFHPVKAIATGEGGMVAGRDPALVARVKQLRSHGMTRGTDKFEDRSRAFEEGEANPWYYEMPELGYNYRLSDIQCALGLSQLSRLGAFLSQRRALVERYVAGLIHLEPLVRPISHQPNCRAAWHLFVLLVDFGQLDMTRSQFMRELAGRGIGSQVHYIPVYGQPYYRHRYGEMELPGAEIYYSRCLSLPLFADMTDQDVDRVVAAIEEILGR